MRRNKFLGQLADFNLIIFMCLSTVSFKTGNIYSSYFSDYMANYIWNIKVFPNAIKS